MANKPLSLSLLGGRFLGHSVFVYFAYIFTARRYATVWIVLLAAEQRLAE